MILLIIIWSILLAVIAVLVFVLLNKYKFALVIGYGIALIQVSMKGRIS